jgi:hypothetical protein
MKKLLSIILLTASLFAQANNIFIINPSIHSAGMGNTGIGDFNSKNLFHNPAFVLDSSGASISNVKWLPTLVDDMGYTNLQYNSSKFGVELFYFDYGTQTEANPDGIIVGDFSSSSTRLGVSYGHDINGWLLGGRLNVYQHDFYQTDGSSTNFGLDLGIHKSMVGENGGASFGIVLKDLGGESEFQQAKIKLPMSLGLGMKYSLIKGNFTFNTLTDIKLYEEFSSFGVGTEYLFNNMGAIRLGYYSEPEYDVDYITFGGGLMLESISIDLAYLINENSFHNETVMLSFGFNF